MQIKRDIFIFDGKSEELLTILSNKNNKRCSFTSTEIVEELNRDFTFEFSVPIKHADTQYILEGNLVSFQDLDGEFQLFQIYKTEEEHTPEGLQLKVYTEHAIYELTDDFTESLRVAKGPAIEAMEKALSNSRWQVGQVDELGLQNVSYYYSTAIKNIQEAANLYGGELRYRITVEGNGITNRFVDLLVRRGADTGRRFEFNKDVRKVKRTVDSSGIKTALYGRGNGEEIEETGGYTRKITFKDIEWSVTNGDPLDKPLGQEWIADPNALALYGRENGTRHRFGAYEADSTDPLEIIQTTYAQLLQVNKPKVTYELSVIDLEHLTGYNHKRVRLGDTVYVIDRELGITIEARVIQLKRSLNNPELTEVVLGNFIPDITTYNQKLEQVQATLTDRKGVWDKATENIENDYPDIVPPMPIVTAKGLFKTISLDWDFDPSSFIKEYEVYGSQIPAFTVAPSNLIFRGKAGGYLFSSNTDETWYFRVVAVNIHGTSSPVSDEVNARTVRIQDVDFEELSIGDAVIREVSADKITFGTLDGQKATIVNLDADNINAGKLKGQYIEAETIGVEHLKATAKNMLNNPTITGLLDDWSGNTTATFTLEETPLKNNSLAIALSSTGNAELRSPFIEVEPIQSYKLSLGLFSEGLNGTRYVGIEFFDKNKVGLVPKHYNFNVIENVITDGTGTHDGYFYQVKGKNADENNGFLDIEGYILQSDAVTSPKGKNITKQYQLVMPSNTQYIRIKILNYYVTPEAPETALIWSPSLSKVDAGKITFDQAEGGTLTLGGLGNEHGVLRILDSEGAEVGTVSGDAGGFSQLSIDNLENAENVVFSTSQYHPNYSDSDNAIVIYVDGIAGDDNGTGKYDSPVKSIQEAVNRVPKYLNHDVYLNILPCPYTENVHIEGFKGRGFIFLRSFVRRVRYIRIWQNGSTANNINHMVEIGAYDFKNGTRTNVALGKFWQVPILTDGNTDTNNYYSFGTGLQWLTLDLETIQNISGIKLWRYYNDGRTYHDTKIEVSEDNVNWQRVQDSSVHGEYKEEKNGYDATRFRLSGYIYVENCDRVEIQNGWIQAVYGQTLSPIHAQNSYIAINNAIVFGNSDVNKPLYYAVYATTNSWMKISFSEINRANSACLMAAYNSRMQIEGCIGGDSPYGVYSWCSIINGTGTAPVGNISNTRTNVDGQIWTTFTHQVGPNTSIPPVVEKKLVKTWTSNGCDTWRPIFGGQWLGENRATQGKWDQYGNNKGLYFFGDVFGEIRAANVKSIDKIRVYVTRASSSGYSLDTPIRVRTHNYTSRPSGEPSLYTGDEAVLIMDRGQGMWVTLPSTMVARFKTGTAKGVGVYTSNTSNREYARMTNIAKVEVSYTILE